MSVTDVTDLRKAYGGRPAVDGVSFSADEGGIFGIHGPDGAGRTTTVECVEGLRVPTPGGTGAPDSAPSPTTRRSPASSARSSGRADSSPSRPSARPWSSAPPPASPTGARSPNGRASKTRLTHVLARLGAKDRAAAVATAYDRGILG